MISYSIAKLEPACVLNVNEVIEHVYGINGFGAAVMRWWCWNVVMVFHDISQPVVLQQGFL